MGKLHSLRRAILRNPRKWRQYSCVGAARSRSGEWFPVYWSHSYRQFIKKVLAGTL